MTVIAARVYEDRIELAADSRVTLGDYRVVGSSEAEPMKVCSVNGMVIGGAGRKSTLQWLTYFARNHSPASESEVDVSAFILEFCEWMEKKSKSFGLENHFLVAFGSSLFKVYSSLAVMKVPEFAAIGSGGDYALAAMYLGHSPEDAARVAAKLDPWCGGDICTFVHKFPVI